MSQTSRLRAILGRFRLLLLCLAASLVGVIAGARRGSACYNIPGEGTFTSITQFNGTCDDGSDCVDYNCDGSCCGVGDNGGEECWYGIGTQCDAACGC